MARDPADAAARADGRAYTAVVERASPTPTARRWCRSRWSFTTGPTTVVPHLAASDPLSGRADRADRDRRHASCSTSRCSVSTPRASRSPMARRRWSARSSMSNSYTFTPSAPLTAARRHGHAVERDPGRLRQRAGADQLHVHDTVSFGFAGASSTVASSRLISATRSAFSRYGMNALLKPAMMISLIVASDQP